MKMYLRDKHKPRNLEELKEGIRAYWKKLTPEVCTRYIDHLQKVMPVVVAEQGAPSGHGTVSLTLLHACKHLSFIGFDLLRIVKQTVVGLPHTLVLGWGQGLCLRCLNKHCGFHTYVRVSWKYVRTCGLQCGSPREAFERSAVGY